MTHICNLHINNLLNNNNNYNNIHNFNIHFSWNCFYKLFFVKCREEYVSWKNAVLPNYFNAFSFYLLCDLLYLTKCALYIIAHSTNILYPSMQCTSKMFIYLFIFKKIIFTQDWFQNNHSIVFRMMNWMALTCNMERSWCDNVAYYYLECSLLNVHCRQYAVNSKYS